MLAILADWLPKNVHGMVVRAILVAAAAARQKTRRMEYPHKGFARIRVQRHKTVKN